MKYKGVDIESCLIGGFINRPRQYLFYKRGINKRLHPSVSQYADEPPIQGFQE
jgi:hypothetical protein